MNCPNDLNHKQAHHQSENQIHNFHHVIKAGFFYRNSDKQQLQRFKCKSCKIYFSTETYSLCKYQKKREINNMVFHLLLSSVSQRRCAQILKVDRKTIIRKFCFLGLRSQYLIENHHHLQNKDQITSVQFDDVETFEHTKCKPLSITIMVEESTRQILGFKVSRMAAKGHLAKIALKKYGPRVDDRYLNRNKLFQQLSSVLHNVKNIKSDANPHYPKDIKRHFPKAYHETVKGLRGCVTGQGELKASGFDPLFSFNHTAAMLRANINRLVRKTWCTTKRPERLSYHLAIYTIYHNFILLDLEPNKTFNLCQMQV